jgi:hypothetical protein
MRRMFLLGLFAAAPVVVPGAHAATIVIVNNDGPGEGFNDPTAVAPVGGNPGVTLGAQRLNVFQEAANIWGGLLPSAVTIRVQAQFNPQSCDASSAVLGSAGPIQVFRDFSGAEVAATWYHVALANKLAGVDLSASNDINATFNSAIDNNDNCLANTDWYYGLDGNEGSDVELLPVVLHELGHGLGFSTLVNLGNGSELSGFSDIYERHIRDNTLGLTWDQMTAGERTTSATNTDNVVWNGAGARVNASKFLGGVPTMCVNSPPALPSTIPIGTANFGPALTEAGVTGDVVLVNDGSGTTTDGCEALINGAQISGNIALIDRGTCAFVTKAQNAQAAGAIAVIIANNVADPDPITLGGTDPTITIPGSTSPSSWTPPTWPGRTPTAGSSSTPPIPSREGPPFLTGTCPPPPACSWSPPSPASSPATWTSPWPTSPTSAGSRTASRSSAPPTPRFRVVPWWSWNSV